MQYKSLLSISLLSLLFLSFSVVEATKNWGLCPSVESNPEIQNKGLNITKMMGIWYEYLITPDLKENKTYQCASWLMMQDKKNDTNFIVVYNQMNKDTNDSNIRSFEMDCEATQYPTNTAVCYFQMDTPKNLLESYTTQRARAFKIIYTDYYSYMIVSVCQSYGIYYY